MRHIGRLLGLLVVLLATCFGTGVASAQAPSTTGTASAIKADTRPAIQHMTSAQATELQREVDAQMAKVPGGVQLSANEIEWNNGKVILSIPVPGSKKIPEASAALNSFRTGMEAKAQGVSPSAITPNTSYLHGCPYGYTVKWYCFFQDANWSGRMLEWSDPHCNSDFIDFNNWGFADETTSWVNTGYLDVYVYDYSFSRLWIEPPNSSSSNVGSFANDWAWYAEACS